MNVIFIDCKFYNSYCFLLGWC